MGQHDEIPDFIGGVGARRLQRAPVKAPANDVASLGSITDLHSGATLTPEQLLTRLARQPRVIWGEA